MDKKALTTELLDLLSGYRPAKPDETATAFRTVWLRYEPKSTAGVTAAQRAKHEHKGTPVAVLRTIGQAIAKQAKKDVTGFLPLTHSLWDDYGREGRIIASIPLGAMELVAPERMIPIIQALCRTCVSWEDADQLAMNAVEPILRKDPDAWIDEFATWLSDDNLWVRRAGITAIGRLPMKKPTYTTQALSHAEFLLLDSERDVKRAVSFAIRLSVRGEVTPVVQFMARHVPPSDPAASWVLCDVIRSMAKSFLPAFVDLIPHFESWAAQEDLNSVDKRSIESALKTLKSV